MSIQCIINQPIKIPFLSVGLVTGLTSFSNVTTLLNGTLPITPPSLTYSEIGDGLYTVSFTPTITGIWNIFVEGSLKTIEVVSRDIYSILRNIEDDSLGSWTWNKTTGNLIALRQDGSTLATFSVVDTLETASKERVS